jgi:hypothetical protein
MGKADLHIHTTHSHDGTATVPAVLEHVTRHTDLNIIAITDHDAVDGALEALRLAPRYGIEVIPGSEVTTAEGHLLALFVTEPIPPRLSLEATVEAIAAQGGIAIAAHPGGRWKGCLGEPALRRALACPGIADTLLGIETFNASLPYLNTNRLAFSIARRLPLSTVGNSDAHMLWMIGLGATAFPGRSAADLRRALQSGRTSTVTKPRPWYYLASAVKRRAMREIGIAHWAPELPGGPIELRRCASERRAAA